VKHSDEFDREDVLVIAGVVIVILLGIAAAQVWNL
jgi:hypothetical protein